MGVVCYYSKPVDNVIIFLIHSINTNDLDNFD